MTAEAVRVRPRAGALLAALGLLILPRCLMRALWEEDERTPPVVAITGEGEVLEVRGRLGDAERPGCIAMRFRVRPSPGTPRETADENVALEGVMLLEPPRYADDVDWRSLPGASRFVPRGLGLRVTRGEYFHGSWGNALVTMREDVAAERLGRLLEPGEVSPGLARRRAGLPAPDAPGPYRASLEAARAQPWLGLLGGAPAGGEWRATPLAWLDGDGEEVDPRAVRDLLEGAEAGGDAGARLSMLIRIDGAYGTRRFALVPLAVLVQGRDLVLRREGARVRWSRSQVWQAKLVAARQMAGLPPLQVPLESRAFDFRYVVEMRPSKVARTVVRVLLTPFAFVLDGLLQTSADALLWTWMAGKRRREARAGGRR